MKQLLQVKTVDFWNITLCIGCNEENNENPSKSGGVPHRGLHLDNPEHTGGVLNYGRLLSVALF
jgi:hypothetical protein